MTKRTPPRFATWIIAHIAPDYRRESLIGDLIEQYGEGRTARWYWSEVAAVVGAATTRLLRTAFSLSAIAVLLRLMAESLAVTSVLCFALESRRVNAQANLLPPLILGMLALLCLVTSALCAAPSTSATSSGKPGAVKRLFAAFTVITLSAATLTWAGTAPGVVPQPTHTVFCQQSR
jgi:hypothetical protein